MRRAGSLTRRDFVKTAAKLAAAPALMSERALAQSIQPDALLPPGVKAVWDLAKATLEKTPTRHRLCVNGLWRWQPAHEQDESIPSGAWGYFKVPGCWPGITDYLQFDSQTVFPHPSWKDQKLAKISAAWYQREVEIPADWTGRRIALSIEYLNSFAMVFVDGKKVGDVRFPAGEIDLSAVCKPGRKYVLTLFTAAMPIKAVGLSYKDSEAARLVKGAVARRGLCGDVYLIGEPQGPRISHGTVATSFRQSEAKFIADVEGLDPQVRYVLRARITQDGRSLAEFSSQPFKAGELTDGRFAFSAKWRPDRLWDLHTPQNLYELELSLHDASHAGADALDVYWGVRFGFRELWIDGRDFYLNGTRLFLSAVPLDNASIGAAWANYAAARQTLERLKSIGINCVYNHNYNCEPGAHLSFDEILRAADDVGMLVALTQPHFASYDWKAPDADQTNGYAGHAAFYARVAASHPSVVFYAMSHNATGYDQDMNPDLIDGVHAVRERWSSDNVKLALRAEAIVHRLDPSRTVYHHAGGNIGSMHTANFYPNFAPIQELSDWFTHWATLGVKPVFLCEYGAPFTWDWTMYRGWYRGKREFGSAPVPWEFCLTEWNAQFMGDGAFPAGAAEKDNLGWEAAQFRAQKVWHRWDYPTEVSSPRFQRRNQVLADYLTDNWRAYRTWGVSGVSPWEYGIYWTVGAKVDRRRKQLKVDWDHLQRPGLSADYIDRRPERMDVAFEFSDWIPTAAGEALLRNNQPVLAYIAGKSGAFTSKDHHFRAGERVEKQLVLINNSRRKITFRCAWSLALPTAIEGRQEIIVETGQQAHIPLSLDLPRTLAAGSYDLRAAARFGDGPADEQADVLTLNVLPALQPVQAKPKIALFDPRGQTAALMRDIGVGFQVVDAGADLADFDTLVIGKLALGPDAPAPAIGRVRDGLKVIVFEQSSAALEKRLGFRAEEHGLRRAFARIPDHPLLAGVEAPNLHDWRGDATTVPDRLAFEEVSQHGPMVRWCDIPVSRVWRCGNRGNVASVLIEKPTRGDFRPIVDGGFSLQFSPLMEHQDGRGMILFCQLDVSGRTEADPAAEALAANLFRYAADWKPRPARTAVYAGDPAGLAHLKSSGVDAEPYAGGDLSAADHVLVVAPGAETTLASRASAVAAFCKSGGRVLAIALDQRQADTILPLKVTLKNAEYISAGFPPPVAQSMLAGVGPADVHNRGPRLVPLLTAGATTVGDGVLAFAPAGAGPDEARIVFFQLAPWSFDYRQAYDLKRTFRRASFTLTRLLANLGVRAVTPLIDHFRVPVASGEKRWLDGLYLDEPQEWDDPYRFFRW